ncbi:hypothetical protein EST38_g5800 [Candolleomyces aberdarensis]|uniref:Uncharacterized protein n=1 Tax=Candolleomyces aberdarensis TaxID=2316362 RepID=A0A4Q2DM95_9AGAR|nr:hypothetical protein EST38_g5800 [Candolleomyces aberdarensis]
MLQDLIAEVAALGPQQLLSLGICASYFGLILWLFTRVLDSIQIASSQDKRRRKSSLIYLFWAVTVASFVHTWFYMFQYLAWSFSNFEAKNGIVASSGILTRVANWLCETSLYKEALAEICFGKMSWWWDEQLWLFIVGIWEVFFYVEGSRHQIKHIWAFMLLSQIVAISAAYSLFCIALLSAKPRPLRKGWEVAVPAKLWIPVFLSMAAIQISPFTDGETFLLNRLILHVLTVLPLLSVSPLEKTTRAGLTLEYCHLAIFLCYIPLRIHTTRGASSVLPEDNKSLYVGLRNFWTHSHSRPVASPIVWDVLWAWISFEIWTLFASTSHLSSGIEPYMLPPRMPWDVEAKYD